ncbi:MAG: SecD/SecF fusion protein, partial [Planctomycetota bacterium]
MNNFSMGLTLLADAADKAAAPQIEPDVIGGRLLMLLALCVLPYVVGAMLARALRLKDYSNRIGTVLLAFTLGLAPFGYQIAQTGHFGDWKSSLRWGIDLAGGTNLIYQVETQKAQDEGKPVSEAMDKMIGTIQKRIKKRAMTELGKLEFGIVANEHDHRSLIAAAKRVPDTQDKYLDGNQVAAVWRDVADKGDSPSTSAVRIVSRKGAKGEDVSVTQVLILQEPDDDRVTGDFLRRASTGLAENGSACVNFSFDAEGAMRFFRLTDRNKPASDGFKRQLAILLNDKVQSAPNLNSAIRDSGQITGNFSPKELKDLVEVLNAGALQLPIIETPISEFSISPLLGEDVRNKGLFAIYISSLAVFVFMLVYYRFAGIVANISLLLNLILIIGAMAICNATFTLPGLAGLVLTIGMAVDSNVLIYERMREEMERGSSLRMMIHNGFDKALSAIVDSNVTTLIAAVVLYMIGTDQIKGFAVSLFIGLTMSMFSALYFGRLMFDIAERKHWIRDKLTMMKLIGVTKFDFISKLKLAVTCSVTFIAIGVAMVLARGNDSLDIDFSGGSSVTFQFVKDQQIDDVRGKLQKTFDSMSLERLAAPDEPAGSERGLQFRLRTKEENFETIRKGIASTFNDANYELKRVTVSFTALAKAPNSQTSSIKLPEVQVFGAAGQDEVKAESTGKKEAKPEETKKAATEEESKTTEKPAAKTSDEKPAAKTDEKPASDEKAEEKPTKKEEAPVTTKPADGSSKSDDKSVGEPEITTPADPFANAHRTELTFSSELSTSTAADYLLAELRKINTAYEKIDAGALFRIEGTSGSGMAAAETKAKKYDKMQVDVRSTVGDVELGQALTAMQTTLKDTPIFEEVSNFAASVAEDMRYLAILALLASGVGTIIYLWFRFTKADFGIAAVVAVFHDVLFTLACLPMAYYLSKTPLGPILGLEDFKLNLSIVAAFMTIIGYSLNDTIVIFDRVRE